MLLRMILCWTLLGLAFSGVWARGDDAATLDPCDVEDQLEIEKLERELDEAQRLLNEVLESLRKAENNAHALATFVVDELKAGTLEIMTRDLNVDPAPTSNPDPAPTSNPYPHACINEEHLRLVNGSSEFEGRVEVKDGDQWKTICEDGWSQTSAKIVCAMLGFPNEHVAAVGSRVFGNSNLGVLSASGSCTAPAGVVCGDLKENYPVRLVGGSGPYEGRVEVQVNGQWGSLCDNGWDTSEAMVICHMLGYSAGALGTANGFFGNGTGVMWGYQFNCQGTESHIMECGSGGYLIGTRSICSFTDAAGVICSNFYHYPLRLVNGSTPYEGRVEVRIDNHWVQIYADYYWDPNEAAVVCRQLGYSPAGARAISNSQFGYSGDGHAELSGFNCRGDEQLLLACPSNYPLKYNTWNAPNNIAGVICQP